jgi:hypothetical protein
MRHLLWTALLALVIPLAFTGCGGGSDSGGGGSGGSGKFVGTWQLTQVDDGTTMFAIFAADGSTVFARNASGSSVAMSGTYTVDGNTAVGPLHGAPGEAELSAVIDGDAISYDFIEHWHSPYKHNRYTGSKI